MKRNLINNYVKGIIFIIIFITLVLSINNIATFSQNEVSLAMTNYETANKKERLEESLPEFKINFELQKVTIKTDEEYKITSFINEEDAKSLEYITYSYKNEAMSDYQVAGNYEIIIVFKDLLGNEVEKSTRLMIEKKEEVVIKNNTTTQNTNTNKNNETNKDQKTSTSTTNLEKEILANNKKLGDYGRIYFSSLYSVAMYTPKTGAEAQEMVDAKDSAAYYQYGKIRIVADHAYQGFDIIKKQNVGDYIYIKTLGSDGEYVLERYIVREKTNGFNTTTNLITSDNRDIGKDVDYPLALYTCNTADGKNITILLLDRA